MALPLVKAAEAATVCGHPHCSRVIPQGALVYPARLRDEVYCSQEHRARDGARIKQNKRRAEHPTQKQYEREQKLWKKYGITAADWDRLFDAQLGRCAICQETLAEVKICVDHDHETGAVRGLLCNVCNQGLGYFKDDVSRLRSAVAYLTDAGEEV